ncbi:hypothetical protein AAFC00_005216 [Neodothiora populina]|uniref:EDC4-like protein pdc1 beta-propeller domain-containing protein n=1 Tax=Neodothiora populina TaxID=2781224 RepID=A0ABR3PK67_9PEZI
MADLQELFSRLKSPAAPASGNSTPSQSQQASIWAQPQPQHQTQPHHLHHHHHQQHAMPPPGYQHPSVSSPMFSPPLHTPNPHHPSAIMSPTMGTPHAQTPMADAKANNLLNLLKFSGSQQQQQQQQQQQSPMASLQNISIAAPQQRTPSMGAPQPPPHASQLRPQQHNRNVSASDLVASFQPKQPPIVMRNSFAAPQPDSRPEAEAAAAANAPPQDTQNFLLGLLRRPKQEVPVASPVPQPPAAVIDDLVKGLREATIEAAVADAVEDAVAEAAHEAKEHTPVRHFGSASEAPAQSAFEAPSSAKQGPVFTYVNPFEQLSATPTPSTRTASTKPAPATAAPKFEVLMHGKRDASGSGDGEPAGHLSKTRKLAPSVSSPVASPLPTDSHVSQSPAHAHAHAPEVDNASQQSVSQALSGVGEAVDKQVEKALAAASEPAPAAVDKASNGGKKATVDDVADSWESADAEESPVNGISFVVPVYNFPMKPFVSIAIQKADNVTPVRPDSLMDVARLKKDFEQIDRTLVTASTNHIVYSMSKDGGFRIIRQDSGKDKKVFTGSERIFNLNITPAARGAHEDTESILGTGVNGSVFWTNIVKVEGDAWDEYNLESQGFILPPVPVQDDNTSGSPVKTRAKMSSRHADFFAISRGKSIYIIAPYVARHGTYADKKTRVVENQKYLEERCLKIHTGKAGKDFAFSEDDSLLVSLDKSGRIKFWDIREMTEAAKDTGLGKRRSIELKAPLLTLTATLPLEKATPSSIMFVDKERPCVKGVALRYLIVGLKQNHILQLWDLGLHKPVQEIHFPHDKDSDAICSIAYHPKTGIIALGHPTRNSIYFIHLSAPRYNIQSMDQARYVTMLASEDPALARPESTAIMSGIRELSFASKGQLRSVDMLKSPVPSGASENALFELYAMHSKGVTTITIKHEDLGWSSDNKVMKPVDAEEASYITVSDLRATATSVTSEASSEVPSKAASKAATSVSPSRPEVTKPVASSARSAAKAEMPSANGAAKIEKPKKATPEIAKPVERATNPAILTPASYAMAAQKLHSPSTEPELSSAKSAASPAEERNVGINGTASANSVDNSKSIDEAFSRQLGALYSKLDNDRRVQDAAAAAKQDAVLRLVSSTLTENVERSLSQIVTAGITNNVLPSINGLITSALDRKLESALSASLSASVSKEVKAAMPAAIALALQDKELHRSISEQAASKVAAQTEQAFATVLRNSIVPNFTKLAVSATEKAVGDVERRFAEQLRQSQAQRQQDNARIEQLTNLVASLSNTVDGMAASQAAFQEQILKLQRQGGTEVRGGSNASAASDDRAEVTSPSAEEREVQAVTSLMTQGKYEEATIQWLQSPRQAELFDQLFVRVNPQYLQRLSPLVSLSVSAALTASFGKNVNERLEWLASVLSTINLQDPEIREVAPKIMDVLQQRMQGAFMTIADVNGQDPALRKISHLSRQIAEIKNLTE